MPCGIRGGAFHDSLEFRYASQFTDLAIYSGILDGEATYSGILDGTIPLPTTLPFQFEHNSKPVGSVEILLDETLLDTINRTPKLIEVKEKIEQNMLVNIRLNSQDNKKHLTAFMDMRWRDLWDLNSHINFITA